MTLNGFNYFLGEESEQFNFIKVPKMLFTDKRFEKLSYGAKILYGLLLDRMSLSRKNKWMDAQKRVYVVYTIENIGEDFHVSQTVAVRFLKELETFGLIEKKKRPNEATMIYVKNFIISTEEKSTKALEDKGFPKNGIPEFQNMEFQNMESQKGQKTKGILKNGIPGFQNTEFQKMESNKTKRDDDNNLYSSSSFLSGSNMSVAQQIMMKINYQKIVSSGDYEKELVDKVVQYLVNIYLSHGKKYKVNGTYISEKHMQDKIFGNMTEENIRRILNNIAVNGTQTIYNLQSYIYTCLYNLTNIKKSNVNPVEGLIKNPFNQFRQNTYDFEKLEKELLDN